jgi:hypothetical protein
MWIEVLWSSALNAVRVLSQRNPKVAKKQLWFLLAPNAVTKSLKQTRKASQWYPKLFSIALSSL